MIKNRMWGRAVTVLEFLYRVADDCFQLFRSDFARVGKVNLVMTPSVRNIVFVAVAGDKLVHSSDSRRFVVVRAGMHALHAKPFFDF